MGTRESESAAAADDRRPAATAVIMAGQVVVSPDELEAFMSETRAAYPVAAANPGNVLFSFAVEDAASGTVTVLEQWASEEAFDRHVATPEVSALLAKWGPRIRSDVRRFDVVEGR